MAITVNEAFDWFLENIVNLDPEVSRRAKGSQAWLIKVIHGFEEKFADFPCIAPDYDIAFGSFARKTKIRELNDIDIMIGLHGQGSTYFTIFDHIEILVREEKSRLHNYLHDNCMSLNSRKIVNAFVGALREVPQYKDADIARNQEAAILNLSSYPWSFDIVPCFRTSEEDNGRSYYLIPDGKGYWKKSDPRLDRDCLIDTNNKQNGRILNCIRLIKFWNKRPTMPSVESYLIETILIYYFASMAKENVSKYIDIEFPKMLDAISASIFGSVNDLKNIQGNINNTSADAKYKIWSRANLDAQRARDARALEASGKIQESVNKWAEIFGPEFPTK